MPVSYYRANIIPLQRTFGFRSKEEIGRECMALRLLRGDFNDLRAGDASLPNNLFSKLAPDAGAGIA